jgi:L-malate glycosyltransferase
MKVLFYNHTGEVSGAERMLLLILARLDRVAFEPTVICPHGPLEQMARDLEVRVESMSALEARFTWRIDQLVRYFRSFAQLIRQIRTKVSQIKPDLIHANSIRSGLVATAATFGMSTRVVWHLHDILPRHPLSSAIRLFALLSTRTRMIAVSEAVARNFCGRFAGLMKSRVGVILNAIDLEKFACDRTSGQALRQELGLNKDDLVFGIIGQLTPRKGQLELIRAFARARVPQSVLLIVGAALFNRDREYALRLEQEAKSLGVADRVQMLGSRNDIATVMQALDLLIVNSSAEPFGLVIVEAMACGTAVLAAAVDGIPEIIKHDKNGWLVPPRDEPALAEAIIHLSRETGLRARLAGEGPQYVGTHFSANCYMNELGAFYYASENLKRAPSDSWCQKPARQGAPGSRVALPYGRASDTGKL